MIGNVLTRKEACSFLGCSRTKLYQLEQSGVLENTYYDVGRKRYYYTDALERWKQNGGTDIRSANDFGNNYNHIKP